MNRTLENISDGKLYDIDDWVEADAKGCEGCSACCHDVGDLVVLTPFDVYAIGQKTNKSFEELVEKYFEIREKNKVQLPYLKMVGEAKRCSFLDAEGRCAIHSHRPNICRLFPLGRIYEQDSFKYFLQVGSCPKSKLASVQIREWLDIEDYEENKAFILAWHQLIKALSFRLKFVGDLTELETINRYLRQTFYEMKVPEETCFYTKFFELLPEAKNYLGIL